MSTRPTYPPLISRSVVLGASILVIAALHLARDVVIPITLAVLLAFLLSPLVQRLKRRGFSHVVSVVALGGVTLLALIVIGGLLTVQIADLASELPHYRHGILSKLRGFLEPFQRFAGTAMSSLQQLAPASASTETPASAATQPIVRVVSEPDRGALLFGLFKTIAAPVATFVIVTVLAGAMLLQGSELRDRVIRLFGIGRIPVTSEALDDAAERVSRYLLVQTMLNGSQGAVIAIVFTLIGMPGAIVWGFLWAVMRFIPFIGSWIGASLPILLAFGHFSGWTQPLVTIALFIAIELLSNFVFEPWLYGSKTGLSPLAILVSAMFWGWLWGPVGLILATPLSACLVVVGRYVKQLEFLNILLCDKPVLPPSVRLYRRLLTDEWREAGVIVADELKTRSRTEVFEEVVIPALARIDSDRERGRIAPETFQTMEDRVMGILTDVEQQANLAMPAGKSATREPCLCLPARDRLDVLCGHMLRIVLAERGIPLEVIESGYLANEKAALVSARAPGAVLISALSSSREQFVRHTVMRIRAVSAQLNVIAGLWAYRDDLDDARAQLEKHADAIIVTSFAQALDAVRFVTQASDATRSSKENGASQAHQRLSGAIEHVALAGAV